MERDAIRCRKECLGCGDRPQSEYIAHRLLQQPPQDDTVQIKGLPDLYIKPLYTGKDSDGLIVKKLMPQKAKPHIPGRRQMARVKAVIDMVTTRIQNVSTDTDFTLSSPEKC